MIDSVLAAYVDGGVVLKNPSPFAGTWAIVLLGQNEQVLYRNQGSVTPEEMGLPTISNNLTELLAAVEALEALPDKWDGVLFTDSQVTQRRLVNPRAKMNGIPSGLQHRLAVARYRLGRFNVGLLAGHPTRKQLSDGRGRRGLPVSRWNVECDRACTQIAREISSRLTFDPEGAPR